MQTERSEEILTESDRISLLRRVQLVINRNIVNPDTSRHTPSSTSDNVIPVPPTDGVTNTPVQPVLPSYCPVNIPDSSPSVSTMYDNGLSCPDGNLSMGAETADGHSSPFRSRRRLSHYIAEPNVGRGYIKEIAFGAGGRIVASPFGYGVRLLSFDPDCSELCDRTLDFAVSPIQLHEVVTNICHGSVVVTTKFSPDSSLLVTGSLGGKVGFHRPRW